MIVHGDRMMKTIRVNVSKPYDVLIGRRLDIPKLIKPACPSMRVVIVTDDIVSKLYLSNLEDRLCSDGFETFTYIFPNGEQSKNIETLSGILEFLAENHIRRNDLLIALGGGVVGDITGLAAAIYMRGISVVQIPTTLLAAVDSSVGGKTAIDLKNGKNLAGAFWQPSMVICDASIIEALPDEIFAEGMAEVIKCNVIKSLPIIGWIMDKSLKKHLDDVIYECVLLKRDVVEQDEFDLIGIRNVLNVGHTVAHAIEKLSCYKQSHGHAVATGMVVEAKVSQELGFCNEEVVEAIYTAVDSYGLFVNMPWTAEQITETMKNDKKNRDERIVFELPHELGNCSEIKLDNSSVSKLLKKIGPF